jgi:NitT/TauT family transport system permease protein
MTQIDEPWDTTAPTDTAPLVAPGIWNGFLKTAASYVLPPAIALAAALLFWELWTRARDISILLVPPPTRVLDRLLDRPGFFLGEGMITLYEAMLGLSMGAAVAIIAAVVMAHSRLAERALFPLAILIKVTPVVAVAPLLVIWFGFGLWPKVCVAALISFFPFLVNSITGFRSVNPAVLEFVRSLRASPLEIFLKLRVPSALPYLFAALKVSLPLSLIGAVVAEWFSGDRGLGLVIFTANYQLDTPTLFAAICVLAVIGVTLNLTASFLERRVLFWHEAFRA